MVEPLEMLSSILASSVAGIITIDSTGVVASFSPGAERLFGYEASEVVGRNMKILMPDPYRNELDGYLSTYQETGVAHIIGIGREVMGLRKDGSTFPLHLSVGEFTHGGRRMFTGIAHDMTAEVRERGARYESLVRFEQLARSVEEMFIVRTAGTSELVYVSPAVERIYGFTSEQVLANSEMLFSTAHPEDADRARAFFSGGLDAAPGRSDLEYRIVRPDGTVRWMEGLSTPMDDESAGASRVAVTVRDVTARREAIDETTSARAAAERANQAKTSFLSRMSHELRTPLNAILGFGQLLETEDLTAVQRDSVDHILRGGRHLLNLINDVLDVSRVEAGDLALSREPVHASDLVGDAVDLMRPLAAQRGITVIVDGSQACNCYVFADQQRVKQVLLNLLSNAIKYNRHQGSVVVSCNHGVDDWLSISVSDTGMGIPAERMGLLFTPFERLGAEQGPEEGTGIGLALSKKLTDAMGGQLDAVSVLGQGSVFTIQLPRVEGPVARYERLDRSAPPPDAITPVRRVVLHIEDNLANHTLVERILEQRPGAEVIAAMSGRLGLILAKDHRPDLVLLDLHLPDMSGEQVLQRLRDDPGTASIPVVIVSADATPGQVQRLLSAGAAAYLTKPIDVRELLRLIDNQIPPRDDQIPPQ